MADKEGLPENMTLEDLEALFQDVSSETAPAPEEETSTNIEGTETSEIEVKQEPDVTATQAFSKRLKEKTEQAVAQEREKIAQSMGYTSYDDMIKSQEKKTLSDKGYDADELEPIVSDLVEKRLKNDPRMQKLAQYEQRELQEYGKKELSELSKLTNGEISKIEQVPKDVVELWKKTGSLKSAYMQLHGEELITKARAQQSRADTGHLQSPSGGSPVTSNRRPLTSDEAAVWKLFNPGMSDEEIAKKSMPKTK